MKTCPYCAEVIQSAAIKCKHCGSSLPLSAEIESAPKRAPKPSTKNLARHVLGIILVTAVIGWLLTRLNGHQDSPIVSSGEQLQASPSAEIMVQAPGPLPSSPPPSISPEEKMPGTERRLVETLASAQRQSQSAANDMQRGGIKSVRDKVVCSLMSSLLIKDWMGKIKELNANSDGKGVLEVELGPDIVVKTFNNAFSDGLTGSKTLIDPNSHLFQVVSALAPGEWIRFSGTFFRSATDGECLNESSLTLRGKLERPELLFRFSDVTPWQTSGRSEAKQSGEPVVTHKKDLEVRRYDINIDRVCERVSAAIGGSYLIKRGCIENEQESKQKVDDLAVPEKLAKFCGNVAESVQQGYQILYGCIENELASKADLKTNEGDTAATLEASDVTGLNGGIAAPETDSIRAAKPSFDCNKATTGVEKTICTDADLASMDSEYASLVKRTRKLNADSPNFNRDLKAEIRKRDACEDRVCLSEWYRRRIRGLSSRLDI